MAHPDNDEIARLKGALAESLEREARAARAREAYLSKLSHDLRNPMGAIAAATEVLHRIGGQQPEEVRAREVIRRQVQQLTRIVEDLLDTDRVLAGTVSLTRAPVDLAAVAEAALAAFESQGRLRDHVVERRLSPAWVHADRDRLVQAASQLLANAVKFSPPGTRILVEAARFGNDAALAVSDEGAGIAADRLSGVFEPFQRDDGKRRPGLGAGLAIVRKLAELHGGSARAASDGPQRGTRVEVRLPAIESPRP